MSMSTTTRKTAASKRAPAGKSVAEKAHVKKATSGKPAAKVPAMTAVVSKPAAERAASKPRKRSEPPFMVLDSPLKPKHVTLAQIRAALQKVS